MTAVIEDLDRDLSGLSPDCDYGRGLCKSRAVAVAFFDVDCCGKAVNPMLLCAPHRDRVDADSRLAGGKFTALCCHRIVVLLRIEAL